MSKKMIRRFCFLLFIGLFICTSFRQDVKAAKETNSCGKSATWTYDQTKKILTISGKGKVIFTDDWLELEIDKVKVGNSITEIGEHAFNNIQMKEVSLGSKVTKINYGAFFYCGQLEKINFPESLVEIGDSAFCGCGKLKEIVIPDSVTYLGSNSFSGCRKLKKVKLSSQITKIASRTFSGCNKLEEFEIPANIKVIEDSAFSWSGLVNITIPETVEEVQSSAFYYCKNLESVEWNSSIVPSSCFMQCKNLEKVKLGKNVTTIGYGAFQNTGLTTYRIPASVTTVEDRAFSYCKNLTKLTIGKNVVSVPGRIVSGCEVLQDVVIEEGVKSISPDAFRNSFIKSVSLPNSLETIGAKAFRYCTQLESVKIPSDVKKIEDYTFANCESLKKVSYGTSISEIGEAAFFGCLSLDKISIPGNVKKIGYRAFANSGITSLVVKDGVEEIDYWAFSRCPNLKSVKLGATINKIRYSAFLDCDQLTTFEVNAKNKTYATVDNVLYSANMKRIISCPKSKKGTFTIPAKTQKIYGSTFSKCVNITEFAVDPSNPYFTVKDGILYSKDMKVLVACPSGKTGTIKIPSGVKEIADYAFHYSVADTIIIPNGVEKIGYCAFEYCEKLKKIMIPASVKTLGNSVFWRCYALEEIEISRGLTKLPDDAFYQCSSLKKVTIPVSVSSISSTAFRECPYDMVFYTKKSSYGMKYATSHGYRYKII